MKATGQYFLVDGLRGWASFNTALSSLFTADGNVFLLLSLAGYTLKNKFTPLFEMAYEISSSDSQVDNVQMFKVDIIYHRYAHIRIKVQGVGMEADMGHFIYCILTRFDLYFGLHRWDFNNKSSQT